MLPRTIDKARAKLAGTLGDYIYNCPMDKQLFATLGVSADEFLAAVQSSESDDAVLAWLRSHGRRPSAEELAAHNELIGRWLPRSEEGRKHFERDRQRLASNRPDVTSWTDLIDFEEGRM